MDEGVHVHKRTPVEVVERVEPWMGFGHFGVMFWQSVEKGFVLIDKGFEIIECTGTVGERFYLCYRDDFTVFSLL